MSTQPALNFSTRQNKSIERSLVFESLDTFQRGGFLNPVRYVGFGSVWFADFQLAHRILDPVELISIERNDDLVQRAHFNRPFNNISIREGEASIVLPELLEEKDDDKSWVVWLDYDSWLHPEDLESLLDTAQQLPPSSVLLTTFNSRRGSYWIDRRQDTLRDRLLTIFGEDIVGPLKESDLQTHSDFVRVLTRLFHESVKSRLTAVGGLDYVPSFSIPYTDGGADMLTVGGYLSAEENRDGAEKLVGESEWPGVSLEPIDYDPLTLKEVMAMRALLPSETKLNSQYVKDQCGLKLSDGVIRGFQQHYKRFPVYSDIGRSI